ncbi:MAG: hypothetical protein HDS66_03430 [Bacteroidales bacterium]|nr:hypothetical protein [Bacteroidales bacterium]
MPATKLDDRLRTINRRIDRIAYEFGMRSVEYMNQKAIITQVLPSNFVHISEDGKVRIKRGKLALEGLERIIDKIETVERLQAREGSAVDQAQKYHDEFPGASIKDIRRMALRNFEKTKASDNFFYELANELNVTSYFHDRKGLKGIDAILKYDEIIERIVSDYESSLNKKAGGNVKPYTMTKSELAERMKRRKKS